MGHGDRSSERARARLIFRLSSRKTIYYLIDWIDLDSKFLHLTSLLKNVETVSRPVRRRHCQLSTLVAVTFSNYYT
jgi:hypothetical protein